MNWTIENLYSALETWNRRMHDMFYLLTQGPEEFRGGEIWRVIINIHTALQGIGLGLLVLFFLIGVVKTCGSFAELKRPEVAVKMFVRFALARAAVVWGLELMLALFRIVQGIIAEVISVAGFVGADNAVLPESIIDAAGSVGFIHRFPLWAVSLIGGLFITVLAIIMILSVYGRFFRIYMYTAIAPVPLSSFAGEPSSNMGRSFIKSYAAVCLEGAIIVLALVIFTAYASAPPVVDATASAGVQVWAYIGELVFNMLVLVGLVKGADRIVREMLGL